MTKKYHMIIKEGQNRILYLTKDLILSENINDAMIFDTDKKALKFYTDKKNRELILANELNVQKILKGDLLLLNLQ